MSNFPSKDRYPIEFIEKKNALILFNVNRESNYLVELVPVVTGCDWGKRDEKQ